MGVPTSSRSPVAAVTPATSTNMPTTSCTRPAAWVRARLSRARRSCRDRSFASCAGRLHALDTQRAGDGVEPGVRAPSPRAHTCRGSRSGRRRSGVDHEVGCSSRPAKQLVACKISPMAARPRISRCPRARAPRCLLPQLATTVGSAWNARRSLARPRQARASRSLAPSSAALPSAPPPRSYAQLPSRARARRMRSSRTASASYGTSWGRLRHRRAMHVRHRGGEDRSASPSPPRACAIIEMRGATWQTSVHSRAAQPSGERGVGSLGRCHQEGMAASGRWGGLARTSAGWSAISLSPGRDAFRLEPQRGLETSVVAASTSPCADWRELELVADELGGARREPENTARMISSVALLREREAIGGHLAEQRAHRLGVEPDEIGEVNIAMRIARERSGWSDSMVESTSSPSLSGRRSRWRRRGPYVDATVRSRRSWVARLRGHRPPLPGCWRAAPSNG